MKAEFFTSQIKENKNTGTFIDFYEIQALYLRLVQEVQSMTTNPIYKLCHLCYSDSQNKLLKISFEV